MAETIVERGHREAVDASIQAIAGLLSELLSRRMTAYIAGVDSVKTVSRWISGEVTQIREPEVETRLRTAYEIAYLLMQVNSPDVVRAWFISLNPQLDDATPVEVIHEGRLREALAAARAFVAGLGAAA